MRRVLCAALSAAMLVATVPPYNLWPFAILCWVPLLLAIQGSTWQRAALLGFAQGALAHLFALAPLAPALHQAAGLSLPASVLGLTGVALAQAGRTALVAGLTARAAQNRVPAWVAFPTAVVAAEFVWPCLFDWSLATTAHAFPAWCQLAEVGGRLLVSAWIALANAGLARVFESNQTRSNHRFATARRVFERAAPAVALVAIVTATGVLRMRSVEADDQAAPVARIGFVQGNTGTSRTRRANPVPEYRRAATALVKEQGPIDLVLWPETAVPYPTRAKDLPTAAQDVTQEDARLGSIPIGAPLLTGLVVDDAARSSRSGARLANGALLADASGRVMGLYRKQILLPVGERSLLPDWLPILQRALPPVTSFTAGTSGAPLALGARRIGVFICYEDTLASLVRATAHQGEPDLLVNLTSDAWFGDSPMAALHLTLAKLRAIEHRKYLARATNDGVTALVDPNGRIAWSLPAHVATSGVAEARWKSGQTLYGRTGDLPIGAAGLATTLFLLVAPFGWWRRRRAQPAAGVDLILSNQPDQGARREEHAGD